MVRATSSKRSGAVKNYVWVDSLVAAFLYKKAEPYESRNDTIRRLLGLPPSLRKAVADRKRKEAQTNAR